METALGETTTEVLKDGGREGHESSEQPTKKTKKQKEKIIGYKLHDPYKIWIHTKEFESMENTIILPDPISTTIGGKLSELSVAGIVNGFAAVSGGFVDRYLQPMAAKQFTCSAGECTLAQVLSWAHALHQSVQTRVQKDVLDATPQRIADMLCPDLTAAEFRAVRKRVYDTVVLGKGLRLEDGTDEIPVASSNAVVHDIEKVRAICFSFGLNTVVRTYSSREPGLNHRGISLSLDDSSKSAKSAAKMISQHSF